MKIKLCPNEAEEATESENNNSFESNRAVANGETLAPPVFGQTVSPISTRGADHAHLSIKSPPGFSELATALSNEGENDSAAAIATTRLMNLSHLKINRMNRKEAERLGILPP